MSDRASSSSSPRLRPDLPLEFPDPPEHKDSEVAYANVHLRTHPLPDRADTEKTPAIVKLAIARFRKRGETSLNGECEQCKRHPYAISDTAVKLKSCGGCKQVFYCSPECQKLAWNEHKPVCGPAKKPCKDVQAPAPLVAALVDALVVASDPKTGPNVRVFASCLAALILYELGDTNAAGWCVDRADAMVLVCGDRCSAVRRAECTLTRFAVTEMRDALRGVRVRVRSIESARKTLAMVGVDEAPLTRLWWKQSDAQRRHDNPLSGDEGGPTGGLVAMRGAYKEARALDRSLFSPPTEQEKGIHTRFYKDSYELMAVELGRAADVFVPGPELAKEGRTDLEIVWDIGEKRYAPWLQLTNHVIKAQAAASMGYALLATNVLHEVARKAEFVGHGRAKFDALLRSAHYAERVLSDPGFAPSLHGRARELQMVSWRAAMAIAVRFENEIWKMMCASLRADWATSGI